MSEGLVRIRNNTALMQSVTLDGNQIVLGAYDEKMVDQRVADLFAENCPGLVSVVVEDSIGGEYVEETEDKRFVWVANMTGDPDAPAEVGVKGVVDKRWRMVQVPNPLRQPRNITEKAMGGMQEYVGKGGALEALNRFPTIYTVPPFKRRKLDTQTARWMLSRDARCEPGWRGKLIESRAPSQFEPDMTWPLDEMRQYLKLMDPSAKLGETEGQIKHRFARKAESERLTKTAIEAAKELCLKRLHFRLANPKYRKPPTRGEFEEFYNKWIEDAVEAVAEKKAARGRPKTVVAEAIDQGAAQ